MPGSRTRTSRLQPTAIALLTVWSWLLVAHQTEHRHAASLAAERPAESPDLPAASALHSSHETCLLCVVQHLPRQRASGPDLPYLSAPAGAVATRVDQALSADGRTATARAPPLLPC